jgi:hypothetical protein
MIIRKRGTPRKSSTLLMQAATVKVNSSGALASEIGVKSRPGIVCGVPLRIMAIS